MLIKIKFNPLRDYWLSRSSYMPYHIGVMKADDVLLVLEDIKPNGFTKVFVGRFGKVAYCNLWDVSYEILCTGKE